MVEVRPARVGREADISQGGLWIGAQATSGGAGEIPQGRRLLGRETEQVQGAFDSAPCIRSRGPFRGFFDDDVGIGAAEAK